VSYGIGRTRGREHVELPDVAINGGTQTQYLRYVELELVNDLSPLRQALEDEHSERPLAQKRWYGATSTLYHDYPLTVTTLPSLRVRWDVSPSATKFLHYMRRYTRVTDPVFLTTSFTNLQSSSRDEQQQKLRDLAIRGEIIAATYIVRQLYGYSLGEAKQIVDALLNGRQTK